MSRTILYLWSVVPTLLGVALFPCVALGFYDHDATAGPLAALAAGTLVLGLLARQLGRVPSVLGAAEGRLTVLLAWCTAAFLGGLPFLITGTKPGWTTSVFESLSGFTATGSTVLSDIESLPRSLLLWRSLTHWIGGLGIIAMVIAIVPNLSGRDVLFGAESPVSLEDPIMPRLGMVVRSYLVLYGLFTVVSVLLLWAGPMDFFDAVCHSMAAIAGGGFSTRNLSVAAFDDVYTEIVLQVVMIAGAVSFFLHYRAVFQRQPLSYLRNGEVRFFLGLIVLASLAVTGVLVAQQDVPLGHAIRGAFFNVVSVVTTTGFASEDFEIWPPLAMLVLIGLMFVGGCSASTSGSIKGVRYLITGSALRDHLVHILHPQSVSNVRLAGRRLEDRVVLGVLLYMVSYFLIAVVASVAVALGGVDLVTSVTAVAATLGNVGPGLAEVGPFDNFAHLAAWQQWILMFCMLVGRLEIYTVILFFLPDYWRDR